MAWKGESRRHSLARKGVRTADRKRMTMGKMNASGNEDERKLYIKSEIEEFQRNFCPYGYLDIEQAILHADAYGYNSRDLQEWLDEFVDDTGTDRNDVDITWIAYDRILQEIRNRIDSEIGFDLMNDADFDTYGNYMATSYDYSQESIDALKDAIKNADKESKHNLLSDDDVVTWLSEVDIDIKELK